ncbi:SDR family NAD(P)-dependent oxidoreductase, partial [Brucella melitensis]|uniref:SDR family NAD(P)-dependent oxidoreductase n=1 Tax=Brucella melitensis TaxID=29459 RepID=UPI0031FE1C83
MPDVSARKTAIVTGSNSGIGLGIAHALAAAGHNVVINSFTDRDEDHALARMLAEEHGANVIYIAADMSKAEDCRNLIAKTVKVFGNSDILVNNAGIQHVAPVEEFPPEQWDRIIAINLTSAFH